MSTVETGAILTIDVAYTPSAVPAILALAREVDQRREFSGNAEGLEGDDLTAYTMSGLQIIFADPYGYGPSWLLAIDGVTGWSVGVEHRD